MVGLFENVLLNLGPKKELRLVFFELLHVFAPTISYLMVIFPACLNLSLFTKNLHCDNKH